MARPLQPWKQELLFWALMLPALAALVAASWALLGLLGKLPEQTVEYGFAAITVLGVALPLARLVRKSSSEDSGARRHEDPRAQLIRIQSQRPRDDPKKG